MKNIDCIIEQIKEGIKLQKILITRENPETEIGYKNIELYKCKIAELEYRIKELDAKKNHRAILPPKYGDDKYASDNYKETFDMLRVWYYNHFNREPNFSKAPKRNMMFYDPTLFLPVNTYSIKGNIPFQIMFSANYPNHKSDNTKSISVELPFEILSKDENENYLKYMLELIRIYSGDNANLVFGNGLNTKGTLSFIANRNISPSSRKGNDYYDFFDRLCDNNVRNIIYIGDSMKKGIKQETIDKVQSNIIDFHKKLMTNETVSKEKLENTNEKIKNRILSLNNHFLQ